MRHKLFQNLIGYTLLGLAILSICLSSHTAQAQPSNTNAAPETVSLVVSTAINAKELAQQGREFYTTGQLYHAVKTWFLAAKAFQSQRDPLNQAQALNHLSLAYQQLGQLPEATQAIADSLKLLQIKEKKPKQVQLLLAQALNTQGSLQLALGQAEQALTTWQQAATTYTQAGDSVGVIGSLLNQAQALQVLGFYRRALATLNSVNSSLQKEPDSLLKAAALRSLGNVLRMTGDLKRARQVLQQSLLLAQQLQSALDISAALLDLGNTARVQQDTKEALVFYQQAATASSSPVTQLEAQLNHLSLLLETESKPNVQTLLPQIQSQLATLPPSRAAIYARINLAHSLTQLIKADAKHAPSQLEIAKLLAAAVQQAREIKDRRAEAYALTSFGELYEQTQQLSTAQELTQQAFVLAQALHAPDISYRASWQLGRLLKAEGDLKGAIASYTEAANALKSLRQDLVAVNTDIQFSFRDEVEPLYRQLVDLLLQSDQPSQKNLVQARDAIESLQLAELDNFFRVACLQGKPIQVDQVIDKDDPTAAVLYPIVLADRLEVILKLPGQPLRHYKTAITQTKVETLLEELRQKLTKTYALSEVYPLSKQVYDWLIQPIESDLAKSRIKTLVFVLDGSLRNIPMAALYDGQQYLIQKYAVALVPGLQLLPSQPIERVKLKALTAGLTQARQGFSALNNVGAELNQIKSEVASTVLLNQKFTSIALQKEIDSVRFPIVHLATHGQFSSQAAQTFVLAWDKPIVVDELNNLLQTRDTSMHNALELLVLSACETAAGDKRAALGLAGVAVRAGAGSTIASLWSLDDESSALLMGQFYQELASRKVNKAEALRQAQLTLLPNPRYQNPRYWGAYVLVGNWL
ncbi:CHAT domain-containing protein [Chroococcidiopsis sp. CCMEE 29]|uniref:CHAT domain-containing protein n=1 Tax=Chroococcidiopsis sp. CCMEE 29 TaxID=155894 RepID=UPI00201FE678|nr:CHAT domain-containing protein [Chroococcidiopsis sp. CCMEE 29]